MALGNEALEAFKRHVLQEFPREACGVLVDGNYIPCVNVHPEPHLHFQIAAVKMAEIAVKHGRVQAILHSHPYRLQNPPKWPAEWPSHNDMVEWMKGTVPWGIVASEGENVSEMVWLDEENPAPLVGRPFVHGVWDCYSLVRDWYREKGILIPNYPRQIDWWFEGQNHYEENFRQAGFVEIAPSEVRPGDAMLMQIRSRVINHAAVVTGPNEILHHLFHRMSGHDRLDRWARTVCKYVRYAK